MVIPGILRCANYEVMQGEWQRGCEQSRSNRNVRLSPSAWLGPTTATRYETQTINLCRAMNSVCRCLNAAQPIKLACLESYNQLR